MLKKTNKGSPYGYEYILDFSLVTLGSGSVCF